MKWLSVFLFLLFGFRAQAIDLTTSLKETRSFLSASAEMSQFTLSEGTITGNGAKVDFSHYFSERANIEVYLSTAVNSQSGVQSSFTTVGGYYYYTVFGDCCNMKKTVTMDGSPILFETSNKRNSFSIGAGLDQVFLNGSHSVYSISGLGLGLEYQFTIFSAPLKASARYSMMTANSTSIQGLFFGLGLVFGL